jgi:phage tail sheath gpL-like
MISTAVDVTRVSRVLGYKVYPANFEVLTPYLPQRIVILAEANHANQAALDVSAYQFINSKEVGEKYGYGSPMHQIARILRPQSGDPLGGIATIAIAQQEATVSTAATYVLGVTVATTVTKTCQHTLFINGRSSIDGQTYTYTVEEGDDTADVVAKIAAAINGVMRAPVTATAGTGIVTIVAKWYGATGVLIVREETYGESAGIVYAETSNTDGTGAADISDALLLFGENWNTLVINSYGAGAANSIFEALEAFNGIPDPQTPTGRYTPTQFKPCLAFYGSLLADKDDLVAITNDEDRIDQVTNVLCPAPNSEGFPWEAAANVVRLVAPISQNFPHLDVGGKSYPDMPTPEDGDVGDFGDYNARDYLAQMGCSTVLLSAGKYTIQDLVTTYAPDGDPLPKFRFVRDLIVDWNVAYNSLLLMATYIWDKTIIPNNTPVNVADTIKPKGAKQLYTDMFKGLESLALLADSEFSKASLLVGINATNPARLDIFFRYKRTSTAHIVSNDAAVDFNYST